MEAKPLKIFKRLAKTDVEYLVIGGMAAVLYGVPRATFDIDLAVGSNLENLERLLKALSGIGYKQAVHPVSGEHLAGIDEIKPEKIMELESVRLKNGFDVDILILPNAMFKFMWEYKVLVNYKGITIPIPNLIDLIHLKEKSSRPVDLEDVKILRHILGKRRK